MALDTQLQSFNAEAWRGRVDSEDNRDAYRWHQVVEPIDLLDGNLVPFPANKRTFCILGFPCDEGVRQNQGRVGTSKAPLSIRRELANMPVGFDENTRILDAGNIICKKGELDASQKTLKEAVTRILKLNCFPILLGGGHEIALGHFNGIQQHLNQNRQGQTLGIINFDAHFDLRPNPETGSSGTMFRQIANSNKAEGKPTNCFYIGIQKTGNTIDLFKKAENLGFQYILAKDLTSCAAETIPGTLNQFIDKVDTLYVTVCADVFSSAFAPGVSATQPFGMHPETVLVILKHILRSNKTISFDIAEVSPRFDDDNQTSKLAAVVIYALSMEITARSIALQP